MYRSEYFTSQKFPGYGYQTELSGSNRIRIKYCRELDVHIHRDLMAAENMADILAAELLNRESNFYLISGPQYLTKRKDTASQAVKK